MDYNKNEAMKMLSDMYDWEYYGGHHHESIFTRFAIAYWQNRKFNIDKRKITYSALIRSSEMNRDDALNRINDPQYDTEKMEEDREYVIKKLGIDDAVFKKLMDNENRSFRDYPSYFPVFNRFKKIAVWFFSLIMPTKPMMSFNLKEYK